MDVLFFLIIIIFILIDIFTKNEKNKDLYFIILMILLTFFACFRSRYVGTDTIMFWNDYISINATPIKNIFNFRYEMGFTLLCRLLGIISKNPQILIVFTSLFMNFAVYKFIKNNAKNKLSCLIFYFTLNYYFSFMCLMRQGLAIAFLLFAYDSLKKDENFKFFLYVFIASTFHLSAIFMAIMFFLKKIKSRKIAIFSIIFGIFLAFLLSKKIFYLAATLIGDYSKYLTSKFASASYVSATMYTITSFFFFIFGLFVPSSASRIDEEKKDNNYVLLRWLIGIGTVISAASIRVSIFNRFYFYFGFFAMLWLSNNLELLKINLNKTIWKVLIYFSTLCYVYIITKLDWYGILPFSFLWGY